MEGLEPSVTTCIMALLTTWQLKPRCKGGVDAATFSPCVCRVVEVKGNKIVQISRYTSKTVISEGGIVYLKSCVNQLETELNRWLTTCT